MGAGSRWGLRRETDGESSANKTVRLTEVAKPARQICCLDDGKDLKSRKG